MTHEQHSDSAHSSAVGDSESMTLARKARAHALKMVHGAKASHIGSALSMIDILAVLYGRVLHQEPTDPDWVERDRVIISKGHAAVGLYSILAEVGYFPIEELETYGQDGSRLLGHVSHHVPGVELSTGSLGHGLPVAVGLAMGLPYQRVFCVLSDGELNEGSNWEAIQFAPTQALGNLTAIIDYNKIQSLGRMSEVIPLEPLHEKLSPYGWEVLEIDGHNHSALHRALIESYPRPKMIIAHTTKGKGISFMEDDLAWHYKSPNEDQLKTALEEL